MYEMWTVPRVSLFCVSVHLSDVGHTFPPLSELITPASLCLFLVQPICFPFCTPSPWGWEHTFRNQFYREGMVTHLLGRCYFSGEGTKSEEEKRLA